MKTFFKISLISALTVGSWSCSDFLDVEPTTTLTDANFYQSPKDFKAALTAAYSSLTDNGIFGESMYLFTEVRSDNAFPKQNTASANLYRYEIDEFYMTAENRGNANYWAHHYRGVVRCNIVIDYGAERFPDDEEVCRYVAEAKVLRALYYFNLVRAYGPVPLILDVPKEYADSRGHSRRPMTEVYARIISDLREAIESGMLITTKESLLGHVTHYAAEALLGKVFLHLPDAKTQAAYPQLDPWADISNDESIVELYPEGCYSKWDAARYYLNDVISKGKYTLMSSFADLFKPANKHNTESLWEVEYKSDLTQNLGSPYYTQFAPLGYTPDGVTASGTDGKIAPAVAVKGQGSCVPTGDLMNFTRKWDSMWPDYLVQVRLFNSAVYSDRRVSDGSTTGTGTSAKPVNASKDHAQSVTFPYDPYTATTWTVTVPGWGSDDDFMCGKYYSGSSILKNDSDDNWYILRYADVLLMMAEAVNETDGPTTTALGYLNRVRRRAGVVEFSVDDQWVNGSQENLRALIQEERRLELAFEGHRWFDLVRTGTAVEVMNAHFNAYYQAYISNTQTGSVNRYIMKNKLVTVNPQYMLFPIPKTELLVNPLLYPNEGAK